MKKTVCIIFAFLMMISQVSCSRANIIANSRQTSKKTIDNPISQEKSDKRFSDKVFSTGIAREVITPNKGTPLAGYGSCDFRLSEKILDDLYATCLVIKDAEGNIVLSFSLDLIRITDTIANTAKKTLAKKFGIKEENIFFSATHTHSGPDVGSNNQAITIWEKNFYSAISKAAEEAIKDLDQTTAFSGTFEIDNLNFVRRYVCDDGTYKGSNFGNPSSKETAHETDSDKSLQIIKFKRENAKDIVIVNWGAHPCFTGGLKKTDVSADYIGKVRKNVEKNSNVEFMFYQAAAGDLNAYGNLAGEKEFNSLSEYGTELAKRILDSLDNLTEIKTGTIKTESKSVTFNINHETDYLIEKARNVQILNNENKRDEATALAKEYGFSSVYTANGIAVRYSLPATGTMTISVMSFGDIAFAYAPYEMFTQNGLNIKTSSPFKMTFVCEQSNGAFGYIPTKDAFSHGGYEVETTKYLSGTGELLESNFIEMLENLNK